MDGDGVLDIYSDLLFLPAWVLSKSSYTKISKNNNLKQIFDIGFNGFNSDDPRTAIEIYVESCFSNISISTENRDIFLALVQYTSYTNYPDLALVIISWVETQYLERFGVTHPFILLYKAESMINLGQHEQAMEIIKQLLLISPNFIPAKVYSWRLEKDLTIKQEKYEELKTMYPNHWIVRQI